jgi:hypothetical protein
MIPEGPVFLFKRDKRRRRDFARTFLLAIASPAEKIQNQKEGAERFKRQQSMLPTTEAGTAAGIHQR